MIVVIKVSKSEFEDDFDVAVIDINDELKKSILNARELFQMVKTKEPSLAYLAIWDCSPAYYREFGTLFDENDDDCLSDEERDKFECDEYILLDEDRRKEIFDVGGDVGPLRTETDRLIITDEHFYWRAHPKHSDGWVETRMLSFDVLLK